MRADIELNAIPCWRIVAQLICHSRCMVGGSRRSVESYYWRDPALPSHPPTTYNLAYSFTRSLDRDGPAIDGCTALRPGISRSSGHRQSQKRRQFTAWSRELLELTTVIDIVEAFLKLGLSALRTCRCWSAKRLLYRQLWKRLRMQLGGFLVRLKGRSLGTTETAPVGLLDKRWPSIVAFHLDKISAA